MTSQEKTLNQVGIGEVFETLRVLGAQGLKPDDFKALRSDPAMARAVVKLLSNGKEERYFDPSESEHHAIARDIMGRNFLGVPENCRYFGITPIYADFDRLKEIPYEWGTLRECKGTHALVADFGLAILDVRKRVDRSLFCSCDDAWYNTEQFVKEEAKPQWLLIRKDMVPDSTSKNWHEQQELLSEDEEVPSARAMIYTIILNYLVTDERMFESNYVRTNSVDSNGFHVCVGGFGPGGLRVRRCWDDYRYDYLGVASARK